jgi:hypothetical protein
VGEQVDGSGHSSTLSFAGISRGGKTTIVVAADRSTCNGVWGSHLCNPAVQAGTRSSAASVSSPTSPTPGSADDPVAPHQAQRGATRARAG